MQLKPRVYLATILTCGAALILRSLYQFHSGNIVAFATLFVLAGIGSGLKVRFPGVQISLSVSFLPILLACVLLSPGEAALTAGLAGFVQCSWRARRRPSVTQIAFNVANLAISAWVAAVVTFTLTHPWMPQVAAVASMLAATIYYLLNAITVCGMFCLVDDKPFSKIWNQAYWLSLPYYVAGAALVFVAGDVALQVDWRPAVIILPIVLLGYRFYSRWVVNFTESHRPA